MPKIIYKDRYIYIYVHPLSHINSAIEQQQTND